MFCLLLGIIFLNVLLRRNYAGSSQPCNNIFCKNGLTSGRAILKTIRSESHLLLEEKLNRLESGHAI